MDMEELFNPESIAIVGASAKPGKIGYSIMRNLVEYGYDGLIYPVNIKGGEMTFKDRKFKVYKSVLDVPGKVDMAVVAVPAAHVPQVVDECGRKGVKVLPIISSGFGELGEEGKKVEQQLVEKARGYGMRVIGPNIFGVVYTPSKLNATFGPTDIIPGKLAFISQSGALGIALMGWTILEKIGLSALVSIGNKSDVDDADLLDYLEKDKNTEAILIYMEGIKDGRKFMQSAKRVSRKKPIVVIKAGRSERGARAVASHTGSLAGADRIYTAAFEQTGVLRAFSISEAFDWGRALSNLPEPQGDNVVIITNGGGVGVMATDACEEEGLKLYDNLEELKVFANYMPPFGSYKNPVDLTGMATAAEYEGALKTALAHPEVHAVVVLSCQTAILDAKALAEVVINAYTESGKKKPLVVAMVGGTEFREAINVLNENGIPTYPEPERAIGSVAALYRWHNWKTKE